MKSIAAKAAATLAFAFMVASISGAQTASLANDRTLQAPSLITTQATAAPNFESPALSFHKSNGDTWHTVMIVSAVFLFAGLVNNDSSLIILGGAGVLVSLSETGGNAYRFASTGRGIDLVRMGRMSFGVNPFGSMNFSQGFSSPHPSFIFQAKFKF